MDNALGYDSEGIVENILIKLPILEAQRTSILSKKWRYKWASMTHLLFDERCVPLCDDSDVEPFLIKFITEVLFLHQGPIHKFQLSNLNLGDCPEINQWLLFLSRNGIQELILELRDDNYFRIPSCIFNCGKLTSLELWGCELDPASSFKGFMCLKSLSLQHVLISPQAIQGFISNCPVLESLSLSYGDSQPLTVRASKLKYLCLQGKFKDICLEDTPLLIDIYIAMCMTDHAAEDFKQSSNCNYDKLLGGVPNLEKLVGHTDFTKYLSIGNGQGHLPIMYNKLKTMELHEVNFEDTKEILVVLRLIRSSPNLQDLHISVSSSIHIVEDAPDLDFWEMECPDDAMLRQLKVVELSEVCGVPHEMKFINFLLGCSPILESLRITSAAHDMKTQLKMSIEMLKFRRASARAEILFIHE